MITRCGRSLATTDAVRPLNVGTSSASAPIASARSHAAFEVAWLTEGSSDASGRLDPFDAQTDEPVVDQDRVPRLEHLADDVGADRELAVGRRARRRDD